MTGMTSQRSCIKKTKLYREMLTRLPQVGGYRCLRNKQLHANLDDLSGKYHEFNPPWVASGDQGIDLLRRP